MKAIDKVRKARAGLILDQPFFGSLALRLNLIEDPNCDTAWTDGERLGFKPGFIDPLSLDEVKGLLAHEVMHLVCQHQARRGNRQKSKWNRAGDYAINPLVLAAHFKLPAGALIHQEFSNKSADEIYNLLPDQPDGSSSKGDEKEDPGACGAVRDPQGGNNRPASSAELELSAQKWRIAAAQAAQQARAMGNLPADLDRLVSDIVHPKVAWQDVLRHFVERSARNDYSWTQPNRRYLSQGFCLPSLRSEELGPLVVAVDTSGSISPDDLKQFAAELTGILEHYATTCTVIYCDARVNGVEIFGSEDLPLALHAKGGGGTDFRPPFEYVKTHSLDPACLIYLTDMACSRYPQETDYPVLWAQIGEGGSVPPFGEVIHIQ